jgi:hypothetical protein
VLLSICYVALQRVLQLVGLCFRSRKFKELEIVVLRHELTVLRRRIHRLPLTIADRVLLAAASQCLPRAIWTSFIVTPDDAASVAPAIGRTTVDVRSPCRPTPDHACRSGPDSAGGAGESAMGISARRRRAERARRDCVGHDGPEGFT